MPDATSDAPGDAPSDGAHDAVTDGPHDASTNADGGPAEGGSDASDASIDSGLDAGIPSCAVIDLQPDGSARCGNGWRDPTEECDLGDASSDGGPLSRAACSATCTVVDLLDEVQLSDGGLANAQRTLGGGRHQLAASDNTFAVATLENPTSTPTVAMTTFTRKGLSRSGAMPISVGSVVTDQGDPVIAALPCDHYVAAWNDLNGDGDGLGVALRLVTPGTVPSGKLAFANKTTALDQYGPDLLWTGSSVVAAWTDTSNVSTGPDVVLRTFDLNLDPTSDEQVLANTADLEGDVTLAAFEGSWAAAWRDDANGLEQIRVHTGSTDWTVGPAFLPPSVLTKIALVELNSHDLLVGFSIGVDPAETGVPNASSMLMAAIVSLASPGTVSAGPVPVNTTVEGASTGLAHAYANAVVAGGLLYGAWWTAGVSGDPNGEQIWFAPVAPSADGGLTPAGSELLLPRTAAHRGGDQRGPAMAVNHVSGGAELVTAWDDLGKGFGQGEGTGDVVVEVVPLPILRNGSQ
ncbi:MAG: hypothetical protein ACRENE_20710 [Polyangiaceae bacterium]